MAFGPTTPATDPPQEPTAAPPPLRPPFPWDALGWFAVCLVALYLVAGPVARFSQWHADATTNTNYAEALAWHAGHLDIDARTHDSARFQDKTYSVNPPLFTLIAYAAIGLAKLQHLPTYEFYPPWYLAIVALPLPFITFAVLYRATGRAPWAALLTLAWIAGTPVLACLNAARDGGINHVNHLLSQPGLFLMAGALICGGRLRWALLGLVWAAWARPLSILFGLPVLWYAWTRDKPNRGRNVFATALGLALAVGLPMTLNHLKFGSALECGYRYVYEGRQDEMARRGRAALFSPEYFKRNAWYMNVEVPRWEIGRYGVRPAPDPYGGSIWFSMPLLLFVFASARGWLEHAPRRWLMLASVPLIAALLCYHNTGYIQPGYYRYSLDWLPIWLVAIAPATCASPRARALAATAIVWSLLYFNLLLTATT